MIRAGNALRSSFDRKPASSVLLLASLVVILFLSGSESDAQTQNGCGIGSYRIVSQSWDTVLKRGWEWRQECDHPDWPLRLVAVGTAGKTRSAPDDLPAMAGAVAIEPKSLFAPILVKAGGLVRLWMQDDAVRIEMAGIVEQSAHQGERVMVQVSRQDDDAGLTVQRIPGRVSGANEVEMER